MWLIAGPPKSQHLLSDTQPTGESNEPDEACDSKLEDAFVAVHVIMSPPTLQAVLTKAVVVVRLTSVIVIEALASIATNGPKIVSGRT